MIIDDLQILLPNAKLPVLNLYIRKATTLITLYLNLSDVLNIEDYADAVEEYVVISINKRGNEGLKQFSFGSSSGTYGNDLPDSVIALLPVPYATMIDTSIGYNDVILP